MIWVKKFFNKMFFNPNSIAIDTKYVNIFGKVVLLTEVGKKYLQYYCTYNLHISKLIYLNIFMFFYVKWEEIASVKMYEARVVSYGF